MNVKDQISNWVSDSTREMVESNYNEYWNLKDHYPNRFIEIGYSQFLIQLLLSLHGRGL